MIDTTNSLIIKDIDPKFRYSQSSTNSTNINEIDYNLYCFSQGYKNQEKGYWRGVLRNKNIDFDLRFNKDWNRRIELEGDSFEKSDLASISKISNELIAFVNDNEIGWDSARFQNFKKKQIQTGGKKQKNKEWLLSNGVKRKSGTLELRTQNYKQFEEREKNKELKKAYITTQAKQQEEKLAYTAGKQYGYSDKKPSGDTLPKSIRTGADTFNSLNTLNSSYNINEQRTSYGTGEKIKRIESNFIEEKTDKNYPRRNLGAEYGYGQLKTQKTEPEFKAYGKDQNYNIYQKQGVQGQGKTLMQYDKDRYKTTVDQGKEYKKSSIEKGKGYKKVSVEKGQGYKKTSVEKGQGYKQTIVDQGQGYKKASPKGLDMKSSYGAKYYSGKKETKEFKYGQKGTYSDQKDNLLIKKSSDTDKAPNLVRLEISVEKKKKDKVERQPEPRTHERLCSSKKRKLSYEKDGKPLKNTSRLNVSTEKKKEPKPRLDNIGRLEISAEKKKKERVERKPGSRKHDRIHSSKKKRKLSYDKDGKPLTNTARLNVSTEKKKEPKPRLDNHSSVEVSVERKEKKERFERKPGPRKHDRIHSSKKKRKMSYDKDGKPLTNTARLNVSTEKKKEPKPRLDNYSRLEVSAEKKEKERIERKTGPRKHDRIHSSKKKRKMSYDKDGKPLTNTARLNVSTEKKKEPKPRLDNFSRLEVSIDKERRASIKRTDSSFERVERAKLPQRKPYDTSKNYQIKTDKKSSISKKYDTQKPQIQLYTFEKTTYERPKQQQTLQPITTIKTKSYQQSPQQTYKPLAGTLKTKSDKESPKKPYQSSATSRSKKPYQPSPQQTYQPTKIDLSKKSYQQSPQQTYQPSYLQNQPQTQSQKKLQVSSITKKIQQQSSYAKPTQGPSSNAGVYTSSKPQQTLKPSQYPKYQIQSDSKLKGSIKDDKYKVQKGELTKKFDLKVEKPKEMKKQQTTYDLKKIIKKTQLKPGDYNIYETKVGDRADNIGRLDVSIEKKKKDKEERKPEPRTHERLCSSKKRKLSYGKDGKPLKNTSRLNVSTEKKKEPKPRLDNIGRLEISAEKKKKERVERKPGSRKHDRIHSSKKKRKLSYDKDGKPLTNTARLNVSTEKKKQPKPRLDNIGRLEISVEKKKKKVERKPGSRKHDRIHSSKKKRKLSYDKDGKPLTNTARLNVSTEKKKEPKQRLDNYSRLEVSVEGKEKKERLERKTGPRKHDRIHSSKKKRKMSYDKDGKPLTNTARLNVSTEKKKEPKPRLDNFSRLEVSVEGKKKKESIERKPGSRKHDRVLSSKKKRKESYDSEGNLLTNTTRLSVGFEKNKLKYLEKDDNNESKNKERYDTFKNKKTEFATKKYPVSSYKPQGQKQGIQTTTSSYSSYVKTETGTPKAPLKTQQIQTKKQSSIADKYKITKPSYNYPASDKKGIQSYPSESRIQTQPAQLKKYPTALSGSLQKPQATLTYNKNKPYVPSSDYQKSSLTRSSQKQQQGLTKDDRDNNNFTYVSGSSTLKTDAYTKKAQHGRLNKSVGAFDTFTFSSQKSYAQPSSVVEDKKRYVPSGQRASSVPKKVTHLDKRGQTGYQQTPTNIKYDQYKKGQQSEQNLLAKYKTEYPSKPYLKTERSYFQPTSKQSESVKIDLSKYLKNQQTPSKTQKSTKPSGKETEQPEIYEYYPLSKTDQKDKLSQISKKKTSTTGAGSGMKYQPKTAQKQLYKPSTISQDDIYEYNPISKKNIYEYKPASQLAAKKGIDQRRNLAQSAEAGYKKGMTAINRSTFQNLFDKNKQITINLDKYKTGRIEGDSRFDKGMKTPSSYLNQKDKIGGQSLNNRYQISPSTDQSKKDSSQRSQSIQNTFVPVSASYKGAMAYFKLQFLTTKEVCEKFWKSIDSGELSKSMFESQKFSGTASRLSNYVSPEKNKYSKLSLSNENTQSSSKNLKNGFTFKFGNKGMSNSTSESIIRNFKDTRQSYKSGYN